ncbi:2'-5' RNA ligase family protein [Streptomyces sp. NRRL B-24484]|uniref:2'-5' RNA ligase family protein n=1 Tax=Streptomyces sp. NRRL B-24484 TaxID=1463833 RepID=UPI0004BEC5F4|nr:2'-5' RNA ligase family protein [Streptomyces sp. NRRL B-24484]
MQTVELTCAPALDAAVRGVWQQLSGAGLPSLAHNTHPGHRPHLTLASCGAAPEGALDAVGELLAEALPLPVRLTGLLSFSARSRRRVLSWAVVPTFELVDLHRRVWLLLDGAADPNPHYLPGRWAPHIGLTRRLEPEELALAHTVVGRHPDLTGAFDAGRSYDTLTGAAVPLGPL